MWMQGNRRRGGFSVVEAMVVVVIIGILAQLGLSRYRVMTAKSKQAEAKLNLHSIEEMQEVYFLEHGKYQKDGGPVGLDACATENLKNELGFRPKDCAELRYKYNWNYPTKDEATATSSTASEDKYIYPGCKAVDEWTVEYEKGRVTNNKKVIKECE